MEQIKNKLKNRVFQKSKVKKCYDNWWSQTGKEMSEYFGISCYWITWTYPQSKIREKFKIAQKEKRSFRYFIGMLTH